MKAILEAPITVERIAVVAEIAWLERRRELGILCRAAERDGGQSSPAAVQAELPGLEEAGACNVIAWGTTLGLFDRGGALTKLGEDVARTDEAPVPEQGVYGLWLVDHPVLGRRILALERKSSTPKLRPGEELAPLPFEPERGVIFRSVVDPRERFVLRGFPTNHGQIRCVRDTTRATCRLRWQLDFEAGRDEWQLEGAIEAPQGSMATMKHEPESVGIDDLWGLAAAWGLGPLQQHGRWQASERRLAVGFEGISDAEQDGFRKTLRLERADVPGRGSYAGVIIEDVPIVPASRSDAQRWARARLDRSLARKRVYRSRAAVRQLFVELVEGTPLERFAPELPAHDELVGGALHEQDPALYWSLVAPVDLAPRRVPPEELAAVRIDAHTSEPATEATLAGGRAR